MSEFKSPRFCYKCQGITPHLVSDSNKHQVCEDCGTKRSRNIMNPIIDRGVSLDRPTVEHVMERFREIMVTRTSERSQLSGILRYMSGLVTGHQAKEETSNAAARHAIELGAEQPEYPAD